MKTLPLPSLIIVYMFINGNLRGIPNNIVLVNFFFKDFT